MRCLEILCLTALLLPQPAPAWKSDVVKNWARTLGDELWRLSEALTQSDQIRLKYKQMNASVKKKDGEVILNSTLRSVSTMLTKKINAVKCIHKTAEKLAKEFNYTMLKDKENYDGFKYCSAKYSEFSYEPGAGPPVPPEKYVKPQFAINNSHYLPVNLEKDSHFYNISVNTNMSCVQVPTNIYYEEEKPLYAILWSAGLDAMFRNNYQADPSLSWQYFGSSHGILRFYPGMPWNMKQVDDYDCRMKSWYIEAATCSKDVIVLFDVSGSMTGFKNYVARRTLKDLLSTLSNNDYVNVYTFKNDTELVVKCFEDLVQATTENIDTIKNTLEPLEDGKTHRIPLEGNANLAAAYIRAFSTLKERRKNCNVSSTQGCNQLVMLITDYVPGNMTEVFEEHNRETVDGKTYIPVRVFTFLIGKEVTNVEEIRSMACSNRGYFVHIHSVEEVQQQVLKYINVIARPMILAGKEPPPTWTHANIDKTRTPFWNVSGELDMPDEDKLVTSVAIPAFEENDAVLLGVAGTDVPIDSIAKLAQPHQLGVNGYSFIVSNNGYLLLHPLLIATINGNLQQNYNSVDFVEVEQIDDGKGSRELGDQIKRLREELVNGTDGNETNVKVLYHYDRIRRIARVEHDYFYDKLVGTPFSMGISLPKGYGDTELLLKDNPLEAKQGQALTGINVTDYFRFSYRVHRDWVYCKFHYLEGHESTHSEEEIWTFLVKISKNEVDITKTQYSGDDQDTEFIFDKHCGDGRQLLGSDDYYCNEDLVKQLVFDAKLSAPFFEKWEAKDDHKKLAEKYNVSVRFISTSSGLTRWHYIFDDSKNEVVDDHGQRKKTFTGKVFGDEYYKAIEETWYKAAVLQHMINKESLVLATNLPILDKTIKNPPPVANPDGTITMTSSYAIFYKDGASETPASVVGFQFSYKEFFDRFMEITEKAGGKDLVCGYPYNCYVIDSSGYIILSTPFDQENVGQFFADLDHGNKLILQYFVERNIFDPVEVFNYQALCPPNLLPQPSKSWLLSTPFNIVGNFIRWLLTEIVLYVFNFNQYSYAEEDFDYTDQLIRDTEATTTALPQHENETIPAKEEEEGDFSCDHSITLYILNQTKFLKSMGQPKTVQEDKPGNCHPPFWASFIPKTNLLLLVVQQGDWVFGKNCTEPNNTTPKPTESSTTSSEPCHKLDLGQLPRRRLEGCFTYHDKERNITECGLGSVARAHLPVLLGTLLLQTLVAVVLWIP